MWMSAGRVMQVFSGHTGPVEAGAFTPDGKLVVTISDDGSLCVWDPKTGSVIHRISHRTHGIYW